MVVVVKINQI